MDHPAPDRRTFLQAVVVAATGSALVGCSSSDDGDGGDGGGSGGSATDPTTSLPPVPELPSDPFLIGVASGDPLPDSVILWTRLVVDLAAADGGIGTDPVPVAWKVATDEGFDDVVADGTAVAVAALGHSVHVDVRGLEADSWYHYRFEIGEWTSPVGRTRTMPADDASPERLRLAFASCQDRLAGYYPAYRAMAADDLDVVFFLGDYIYEYGSDVEGPRAVLPAAEVVTLDDYRLRYASYKSDPDLQQAHAAFPWMMTWDDHEVENNHAGLVSEDRAPVEEFSARRAAAYQAYYEHQPLRLDPPSGPDWRVYRRLRFGDLAEMFVLDGRQYRDDQACNTPQDAFVQIGECAELAEEDRTMLGAEQESWLADGLASSEAVWKVLAQQTVMSSLVLGTMVLNVDQWDGYPAARERLLRHIDDNDISDVVVLTGDIHSAGAGELSIVEPDGSRRPLATEFVGTSITSSTLADAVPGGAGAITPDAFPGLRYLNIVDHGYGRCTVTPQRWVTEFVVVESIATADAPARVDATLVVEQGSPAMALQS